MLGINEHIFNLAVKIHHDYNLHRKVSSLIFIKSYKFNDVLPYTNLGIKKITIQPILNGDAHPSCQRNKNKIIIQLNEYSLLTLIHELNHIFDYPSKFPINKDKLLIYFRSRIKNTAYKAFTDSLYLSSKSEIKSRTAEFFTYLLVHHYILNKWEAPLSKKHLWHLFTDSTFYHDTIGLHNAVIEDKYSLCELNDLICDYRYFKNQHNFINQLVIRNKRLRLFRYWHFKKFKNKRPTKIQPIEINEFTEKYNNHFQQSGKLYLSRFTRVINNYEKIRYGKTFTLIRDDIEQALLRAETLKNHSLTEIKLKVDIICSTLNIDN